MLQMASLFFFAFLFVLKEQVRGKALFFLPQFLIGVGIPPPLQNPFLLFITQELLHLHNPIESMKSKSVSA